MADSPMVSVGDWAGLYGAGLSTLLAIIGGGKFIAKKLWARKERTKFQTDLYFLRKVNNPTREVFPIGVLLMANLGTERVSIKSLEYEGVAENGFKVNGSCGWYEQPEEIFGIRNRLLPRVLESGQTADLPIIEIGVLTRIQELKLWLSDFDDHRYYIAKRDIEKVRRDAQEFLEKEKPNQG